jgi:hypothetical protein
MNGGGLDVAEDDSDIEASLVHVIFLLCHFIIYLSFNADINMLCN